MLQHDVPRLKLDTAGITDVHHLACGCNPRNENSARTDSTFADAAANLQLTSAKKRQVHRKENIKGEQRCTAKPLRY
jgi:hypothetical protein